MTRSDQLVAFLISVPIITAAVAFILSMFALPVLLVVWLAKMVLT